MYTTRSLSVLKHSPGNAFQQPSVHGPNSGYLVLEDQEPEAGAPSCWVQRKESQLRDLPFPQDRILTIKHCPQEGETLKPKSAVVVFIPVINQPLSSNRYYVIIAGGRNKGKAYACSKEEMSICCSCNGTNAAKPRAFDHGDIYQQMEIECKNGRFHAKSVAPDGIPPWLLGRKYWKVYASKPKNYKLDEALGLDVALHARFPSLNFPISTQETPKVVIGRWYCPFIFVKEERGLGKQMKRSMFYEVTLEQFWEEVYACENQDGKEKIVEVNALTASEMFFLDGKEVVQDNKSHGDGMIWLKPLDSNRKGVGLSLAIWERIRWEENRRGWVGDEEVERIVGMEEYEGKSAWGKFACYVLVERIAFWRMDGSLALSLEFRHATKVRTKWE
ncbi:uncharacterized protein LOC103722424 [Phoenix dactylifera]|uniref:Uncharacterized protein LOC103722424 n=1 Tax=Phoenix dactylifera TaxID=42345 RepID=A0A8B7D1E5_PHODC|nr:uncharacterized protein LOC103722424 [Phoenix dactylifera]